MLSRVFPASRVVFLSIVLLVTASAAFAQTPRPRPPASTSTPTRSSSWEVDVHGGGALGSQPTSGTSALPTLGNTYAEPNGKNTRSVSSWFFGEGTTLFNSSVPTAPAIVPLDPVLNSSSFERHHAGSIGGRVHYGRLGHRLGFETGIDVAAGGPRWTDAAIAGIEASRASFQPAFTLFGMTATSQKTVTDGSATDVTWTGGVTVDLISRGPDRFFATGGVGMIRAIGDAPGVTLVGHYSGNIAGFPLDETDSVTLRAASRNVFFFTMGAGWKRELTSRFGVRADLSAAIGHNNLTMEVDTSPKIVTTTVASQQLIVLVSSTGAPTTLVLSNVAGATGGAASSLRPLGVQQFATFSGGSVITRVNLTAGIFMKF